VKIKRRCLDTRELVSGHQVKGCDTKQLHISLETSSPDTDTPWTGYIPMKRKRQPRCGWLCGSKERNQVGDTTKGSQSEEQAEVPHLGLQTATELFGVRSCGWLQSGEEG
jgi:hypothetical protein